MNIMLVLILELFEEIKKRGMNDCFFEWRLVVVFVVRKVFIFFYYVFNLYDNKIVLEIFIIVRVFLYYI